MGILEFAEENFLITLVIVLGIGLLQGSILARGIRKRFPKLKIHAHVFSIILLVLFSINAVSNIIKFANPDKIPISELSVPVNPEEGISFVINVLGLNAGFGTVLAMFASITIILFFKFADIPNLAKYFIFSISMIMLFIAVLNRFTDYVATMFQILMYAFYQFGITLGIFLVSRRKRGGILSELK